MRLGLRAFGVLAALLFACGGEPAAETRDSAASADEDFTKSDFKADDVLPYAGDWLDPPKALAGIGQFDRLRGTIHDDAKCSTMVAMAAAVVGGKDRFLRFLDAVVRLREGRRDDLAILERARAATLENRLTSRHIHELTEVVVRAYGVGHGAYDEQIAEMIRASGYRTVKVGSTEPQALVDALDDGDVFPLSILAPDGDKLIPHITLVWKDRRGVVRLYDSDDIGGPHVLSRGSKGYRDRMGRQGSSWDLGEKYRF